MGSPNFFDLDFTDIDTALASTVALVPLILAKRVRVWKMDISCDAAQFITLRGTTAVKIYPRKSLGANGGWVWDFDGVPWAYTALGEGLSVILANAVQTSGRVWWTQKGDD